MKTIALIIAATLGATTAQADMSLSFKWGDIPLCTTGNPNTVANPEFVLKGVPEGTNRLVFKLTDLDVPNYNHGGGKVKVNAGGTYSIPSGAFKYKSPCPPNEVHTYQWSVIAKKGSKTLGKATANRKYPE